MKNKRQKKIIEIIGKENIQTQSELIERLRSEGFKVTQATVSRDIRELKLVKVSLGDQQYRYSESSRDDIKISARFKTILLETLVSVDYACNMLVLKTYSGMANAAAAAVDNMGWNEIVGSIAGDDTVLIIMRSDESAKEFCERFSEITGPKN